MPTKVFARRALACVGAALLLASCGSSGPSKSQAGDAISTLFKSNPLLGSAAASVDISVDDMTCNEVGTAEIYDCQVLWTATGPAGTRQQTSSFQFVKLGGQWQAKAQE